MRVKHLVHTKATLKKKNVYKNIEYFLY